MLSLKSQISMLDNFVIREESISPVLAMINKENSENLPIVNESLNSDVSFWFYFWFQFTEQRLSWPKVLFTKS